MSASSFLVQLRSVGISVNVEGDRLIVDAPADVVTAELRAEIAVRKTELIAALEVGHDDLDNSDLIEVRREIADLLAIAYRRYAAVMRACDHQPSPGTHELANSRRSSVHGVVA
jgi:TubC N-terminal docking domain